MPIFALIMLIGHQAEIPRPDLGHAEPPVVTYITEAATKLESALDDADEWGRYGIALHAHQYFVEAEIAYAEAQRLDAGEFRWPYFRSMILAQSETARSLEQLELAIEIDSGYGPAHDRRAVLLESLGREEEAERAVREALRLYPESVSANLHLGQLELKQGRIKDALGHLQQAHEGWPESIAVLSALARAHAAKGDRDHARELAEAARQGREMSHISDPRINEIVAVDVRLDPVLARVSRYNREGRFAQAEVELEKLLQVGHDAKRLNRLLARVRLNLGKFQESVDAARLALAADPDSADAFCIMGHAMLRMRRLDQAQHAAESASAKAAMDPDVLQLQGLVAAARGDDEQAIQYWDAALKQKADPATRGMRAEALRRSGRVAEAIDELKALATSQPSNSQALIALGQAHQQTGEFDAALAAFKTAAKDATTALPGRLAAVVLVEQRRFDEAAGLLVSMRSRWPRDSHVANDLAWLLATCPDETVRDGKRALALMKSVVAETPRVTPSFLDTYAAALAENSRFDEATAVMDRVLTILPETAERKKYLARRRAYAEHQPWRTK